MPCRPLCPNIEGSDMLNYETLRMLWWLILGVLLIGFAVTDGFDMGVCAIFALSAVATRNVAYFSSLWSRCGKAIRSGSCWAAAPPLRHGRCSTRLPSHHSTLQCSWCS